MTSPETTILRQRLVRVITHRVGSSVDSGAVAAATRLTYGELTAEFAPLISAAGVVALWGRAVELVKREYPGEEPADRMTMDEPLAEVSQWLESQGPAVAVDAAAAMFATFAELLTALIGEPLTARYLEKAWPDEFSDEPSKRKKA